MFNIRKFYEDYGIEYKEGDEPHKHCRSGWIQAECPRCTGNPGYHIGFSEDSGQFVCWRCGFVPVVEAIRLFTGKSWTESKELLKRYGGKAKRRRFQRTAKEKDIDCELPHGTLDYVPKRHREYLEERDFDPDKLIDTWDLHATGKRSRYYPNRIIAPVYYRDILMSFQGRDVTGMSDTPYKACASDYEKRHHKHCLYGMDMALSESVLVVEGIADVWRMGIGSVATFGIKYTEAQVLLLYYNFKRIFVMFDQEPQAQAQGWKLTQQLATLGREAENITFDKDCDPGDLSDEDARWIMRELLLK